MREPIFPSTVPVPKYSFTVEETRELCYNQASIRLRELSSVPTYSPKWFTIIKDLALYLNLLTDEQFNKLVLDFAIKKKPMTLLIEQDDLFG